MKITNRYSLPVTLVQALERDTYTKGGANISVTSLWKSPRIVALEAAHHDKLESDVSDSVWALLGKGLHEVLARADKTEITEVRLSCEMEGWRVSGQFDRFVREENKLQDYKVTSAWSLVYDSRNEDWENQLNTYAYLLRLHGHQVYNLEIIAVLRDWSQTEAMRNSNYPQCAITVVPVRMWTQLEAEEKIRERVRMHQQAAFELPQCSDKDQWARPTKYAVMKEGRKTAIKLYETAQEAEAHLKMENSSKLYVEKRPGQKVRCEGYCAVKDFCDQYQNEKQAMEALEA